MTAQARTTLLFLVTEDWYFVSHRLPLARAAVTAGYRVVVATRVGSHGAIIAAAGCEVVPIGLRREGRSPLGEVRAIVELVRLYRSVRPVLVHHVALKPVMYGSVAARFGGRPRIVNALAGLGFVFTGESWRSRLLRPLVQLAFRLVLAPPGSVVLFQNPDDRAFLVSRGLVAMDQTVVIRSSGVDLTEFKVLPEPEGIPVVLLPARMLFDKGVGEFVEAARELRADGIEARFVLVGGEDAANPAAIPRSQLDAWRASGVVEWWGHQSDMPTALGKASLVCLPSYREGLPKALLEAAAVGRALVTTDVPGCREVVRPGVNGLLVPARDAARLAAALRDLLLDPSRRKAMGAEARAIVEQEFSTDRVNGAILNLYARLLA